MRKFTIMIVALALFCEIPVSLEWSEADGPFVSFNSAQAVIGRPVTPGSVAGVIFFALHRIARVHHGAARLVFQLRDRLDDFAAGEYPVHHRQAVFEIAKFE